MIVVLLLVLTKASFVYTTVLYSCHMHNVVYYSILRRSTTKFRSSGDLLVNLLYYSYTSLLELYDDVHNYFVQ